MCVENKLMDFNDITKEIIKSIDEEKFDRVNELLNKRQEIIEELKSTKIDSEIFKKVSVELNIDELEKELNKKILLKKDQIKLKLIDVANNYKVNNVYNKRQINSIIFSKKI